MQVLVPSSGEWHYLCGTEPFPPGQAWPLFQVPELSQLCLLRPAGGASSLSVSAVDVLRLAMGREETAVCTALQHTAALLEQRFAGQTGLVLLPCAVSSSGTGPCHRISAMSVSSWNCQSFPRGFAINRATEGLVRS